MWWSFFFHSNWNQVSNFYFILFFWHLKFIFYTFFRKRMRTFHNHFHLNFIKYLYSIKLHQSLLRHFYEFWFLIPKVFFFSFRISIACNYQPLHFQKLMLYFGRDLIVGSYRPTAVNYSADWRESVYCYSQTGLLVNTDRLHENRSELELFLLHNFF